MRNTRRQIHSTLQHDRPAYVAPLRAMHFVRTHTLHGLRFFGRRCPLTARPAPFSEKGLLAARISVLAAEVEALAAGAVQVRVASRGP